MQASQGVKPGALGPPPTPAKSPALVRECIFRVRHLKRDVVVGPPPFFTKSEFVRPQTSQLHCSWRPLIVRSPFRVRAPGGSVVQAIESFRCNPCEDNVRSNVRWQIAIFYVATQLATEQISWHSHTQLKVFSRTITFCFGVWLTCTPSVKILETETRSE